MEGQRSMSRPKTRTERKCLAEARQQKLETDIAEARRLRKEEGLSKANIAKRLGRDPNIVASWVDGISTSRDPQTVAKQRRKARKLVKDGTDPREVAHQLKRPLDTIYGWTEDIRTEAKAKERAELQTKAKAWAKEGKSDAWIAGQLGKTPRTIGNWVTEVRELQRQEAGKEQKKIDATEKSLREKLTVNPDLLVKDLVAEFGDLIGREKILEIRKGYVRTSTKDGAYIEPTSGDVYYPVNVLVELGQMRRTTLNGLTRTLTIPSLRVWHKKRTENFFRLASLLEQHQEYARRYRIQAAILRDNNALVGQKPKDLSRQGWLVLLMLVLYKRNEDRWLTNQHLVKLLAKYHFKKGLIEGAIVELQKRDYLAERVSIRSQEEGVFRTDRSFWVNPRKGPEAYQKLLLTDRWFGAEHKLIQVHLDCVPGYDVKPYPFTDIDIVSDKGKVHIGKEKKLRVIDLKELDDRDESKYHAAGTGEYRLPPPAPRQK